MLLRIDDSQTVTELQDRFAECFPRLKIEFYNQPHGWHVDSPSNYNVTNNLSVGLIRKRHDPGIMTITSWYKTGHVEKDFKERFGLQVQIYRFQNNGWIPTSASDDLTLLEQMALAQNNATSMP